MLLQLVATKDRIVPIPNYWTFLLVVAVILFLYFAPAGFDRLQYKEMFENAGLWGNEKDPGWETYNSIFRSILGTNSDAFFLIHDCIYTLLFVSFANVAIKRDYRFYFLFLLFISIGFYSGGTNVMRSGLANAIMYFALSRYLKFNQTSKGAILFICLALVASTIHYSIVLFVLGVTVAYFFPRVRFYALVWFICVILSYFDVLAGFLTPLTDHIGASGDRLESYVSQIGKANSLYLKAGWRLDFIVYSAIPLLFAAYYIRVCKYSDRFYKCILCGYLISNSFWLCVIRMPFTDRIAMISWCLIPIVTSYPVLANDSKLQTSHPNLCISFAISAPLILVVLSFL